MTTIWRCFDEIVSNIILTQMEFSLKIMKVKLCCLHCLIHIATTMAAKGCVRAIKCYIVATYNKNLFWCLNKSLVHYFEGLSYFITLEGPDSHYFILETFSLPPISHGVTSLAIYVQRVLQSYFIHGCHPSSHVLLQTTQANFQYICHGILLVSRWQLNA